MGIEKNIIFDIDETLVENEKFPANIEQYQRIIKQLKRNGYRFSICTNRPLEEFVNKVIKNYLIDYYVICEGGGIVYLIKNNQYIVFKNYVNCNINKLLKVNLKINDYLLNENRKTSATIKNITDKELINFDFIPKDFDLITFDNKICIKNRKINKIKTIKDLFKKEKVIFITDYEEKMSTNNSIKIYSVGIDKNFNKKCNLVFAKSYRGILDILKEELKMTKYEQIGENCKILWRENFNLTTEKYTQVSGYIFNEKKELLIVKNGDTWTIPGGHPEQYEYPIGTLIRETMEESCISIKNIKYLGAVEVVEDEVYYQLRYIAKVKQVHRFKKEWETSERKFVPLSELKKYIKWCDGIMFKAQLDSAKKLIGEEYEDSSISA